MRIGITNLKGGTGKTTVSVNLAVCLSHIGYKIGLIDTDTNQNSVSWYDVREAELPKVEVWPTTTTDKLFEKVNSLHAVNDIVIMDGTPNLGLMTTKIMFASDLLIIPIRPGANDFRTLVEFYKRYEEVKAIKPELSAYFLLNEYNERIELHRTIRTVLESNYPDIRILKSVLKSRTAYGTAIANGIGAFEGADSLAKGEVVELTKEIIELADLNCLLT